MVASFERRPRVVTPFTWNPDRIVAGLESAGGYVGRRMADNAERAEIQALVDKATPAGRGGSNVGELAFLRTRSFALEQRAQLSLALRGLTSVVTMLGGVPGRREVIYLSEGLASAPGEDLFADLAERMADSTLAASAVELSLWPVFQDVARAAAAQRVAIHAIDARGLMAPGGDASSRGTGRDWEWHRRSGTQETLQFLADETGGIAVVDSNDFAGALQRIERATSVYYLLGYPLPPGGKPEHEVKVTLKRGGPAVLHYRRRFVERSSRDLVTDQVAAGLVLDLSVNELGLTASTGPARRAAKGRWDVPLKVNVPIRTLLLASRDDSLTAHLELLVATREEDREEESPLVSQRHTVAIPRDKVNEARDGVWPIDAVLAMKPGRYRISVGVRDEGSGLAGYALVRATVGEP
jgi:VWFA-related protein